MTPGRSPGKTLPLAIALCVSAAAAPAGAQSPGDGETTVGAPPTAEDRAIVHRLEESIRVLQQRPILRRHRLEVALEGGLGLADTMFSSRLATGSTRFHLSETWSIGGTFAWYFSETSDLFDEVTDHYELFPERALLELYGGGEVGWTPIYGKFAIFDRNIVHFDLTATAGGGVLRTSRAVDLKPALLLGIGFHVYLTRWLALTAEVRDHVYVETFNAGDSLQNHVVFQGGLAFYLPFGFEYRFPR